MLKFNSKQNTSKNKFVSFEIDGQVQTIEVLDFETHRTYISIILARSIEKFQKYAESLGAELPDNPDERDVEEAILKKIKQLAGGGSVDELIGVITSRLAKLPEDTIHARASQFDQIRKDVILNNIRGLTIGFNITIIKDLSENELNTLFNEILRVSQLESIETPEKKRASVKS